MAETESLKRKGKVGPQSARGRIMAGVVVIIPIAVTGLLMSYVYQAALWLGVRLQYWFKEIVNTVYRLKVGTEVAETSTDPVAAPLPFPNNEVILPAHAEWNDITLAIGLVILMLYVLGWLGTNVAGRRLINAVEALVERIPFVDIIYGAIKRMVQSLGGVSDSDEGTRVILIDFPTENLKAVAFMTNQITDRVSGEKYATVYVPTTPNPTSGYMEIVPIDRITETDLTMEQALSMILSGGATAPSEVKLTGPKGLTRLKPIAREPGAV